KLPYKTENEFLNAIASTIIKKLPYSQVNVLLPTITEDGRQHGLRMAGAATELGRTVVQQGLVIRLGDDQGVTVAAWKSGQVTVVNDVIRDRKLKRLYYDPHPYFQQTRSEMAIPFMLGGRSIGVLDIESDKPFAFSKDDAAIMRAIVTHLAVSLDDHRNL